MLLLIIENAIETCLKLSVVMVRGPPYIDRLLHTK